MTAPPPGRSASYAEPNRALYDNAPMKKLTSAASATLPIHVSIMFLRQSVFVTLLKQWYFRTLHTN